MSTSQRIYATVKARSDEGERRNYNQSAGEIRAEPALGIGRPRISDILKGGYVIDDSKNTPDVLLIATGSEVGLCSEAKKILADKGIAARVISLPCQQLFEMQNLQYREEVMPSAIKARVCTEAASDSGWRNYAGDCGRIVTMIPLAQAGPWRRYLLTSALPLRTLRRMRKSLLRTHQKINATAPLNIKYLLLSTYKANASY